MVPLVDPFLSALATEYLTAPAHKPGLFVAPSCLEALNGVLWPEAEAAFQYLHVMDNKVMLKHRPGDKSLSEEERTTLIKVREDHGRKRTWDLVEETREIPGIQGGIRRRRVHANPL